jgi:LPS O-antigen subunit length determinant protein (WzzB/FepE family)
MCISHTLLLLLLLLLHTAAESRASALEAKLTALEHELSQAESSQNDTVRALARQKEEQVKFNHLHFHYFKHLKKL